MRRLTLKHLETIVAVAESGTIAAAADDLNVTAAALTSRIKLLEDDVGVALFDRTGGRLRLTDAGQEVVKIATRIDLALAELKATLSAHKDKHAGRVTIGVASTAKYFAPRLIAAFARGNPRIEIAVTVGNRATIVAALRDYAIDMALMGSPPADFPVFSKVFGPHPQVVIAPPEHSMAKRAGIDKAELCHEGFIIREEGSGTRNVFDTFFGGLAPSPPRVHIEIGSNETVKQAVMAGLGLTLISAHTVEAEVAEGRLAILDVVGMPIMRQWFAVRHGGRELSPAAKTMWDFVVSDGRGFLPKIALPRE
ncbi:HTH-type transcriptional regulator CbbR [Methylocella tundrae]|uniref:HTH-type transcriptional regulator CbbR n=1 Tax=Methylocella tundrae TaxID=227605 RepID=A0A4V6IM91_METTU|nr:LysR family transcriptional regulator [Methylocella tundrae]WPP05170.1 LysR family transcriptional regulator [Methylocella tundrae]VFU07501.1 HTH-type transcriptional regulator CbbR [Methylocella tundrae]VTZ51071.1 HTH-type transcriptional regulator CbbR [Methylocella tundrae]